MLKKLREKLGAKFSANIPGCSIVKIARLDETFLEVFYSQASSVEGQSLQRKERKRRKKNGKRSQNFCACPSQKVIKRDARGETGELLCCKCIFIQIKANLFKIQPKTVKMSRKSVFCKKLRGSMG